MTEEGVIKGLEAPATRERPADLLLRSVVDSIVAGRYAAGEVLPAEAALAEHFGVSRTIVRESMKRLEEKGMIAVQQGRGTSVRPPASWNVLDPVVLGAVIAHDEQLHTLDELTTVRSSLEGVMAAQAAQRSTPDGRERLSAALQRMVGAVDDNDAFSDADADFHRLVMELSENFLASNIAYTLYSRARSFDRFEGDPPAGANQQTVEEHRAIFEAVLARDAEAATRAMCTHIEDAWDRRDLRRRGR